MGLDGWILGLGGLRSQKPDNTKTSNVASALELTGVLSMLNFFL